MEEWWASLGDRIFASADGQARLYGYPGWDYIFELCSSAQRVCLHFNDDKKPFCNYATAVLKGEPWVQELIRQMTQQSKAALRIQINLYQGRWLVAEDGSDGYNPEAFKAIVAAFPQVQFILAYPGRGPHVLVEAMLATNNVSLLFDASGGEGHLAEHLSPPPSTESFGEERWVGYTGGLSQENVASQLEAFAGAAQRHPWWTDMQTNMRAPTRCARPGSEPPAEARRHRSFGAVDLSVIRHVNESCAGFVKDRGLAPGRFVIGFTGVDESAPVGELVALEGPMTEWGIGLAHQGSPSAPTPYAAPRAEP